jgi:hypothetical protein
MRTTTFLLLIAGLVAGCASPGPGKAMAGKCDPCKTLPGLTDMGKANPQIAATGVGLEQAPKQGTSAFKPMLSYNAGSGALTTTDEHEDKRRQVNAGNQYNGMFNYLPAENTSGGGAGCSPLMVGLLQSLRCCNANMKEATRKEDGAAWERFNSERSMLLDRMESASASQPSGAVSIDLAGGKNNNMATATSSADGEMPTDAAMAERAAMFKVGAEETRKIVESVTAEYEDGSPEAPVDAPEIPPVEEGGDSE